MSNNMKDQEMSERLFRDVVRNRHSVRSFRPDPVPEAVLRSVLEDAQRAPSNCNTQPWQVTA
jgi:nitroreductase